MAKAAFACFEKIREFGPAEREKITVVTGSGNNGGDGLMLAALFKMAGCQSRVIACTSPDHLSSDARDMYQYARAIDVDLCDIAAFQSTEDLQKEIQNADIVIDALIGTGLNRPLENPFSTVVEAINQYARYVVGIDIPSGINGNTGAREGLAINANMTVSLITKKIGLYTGDAPAHIGRLYFAPLVDSALFEQTIKPSAMLLNKKSLDVLVDKQGRQKSISKADKGHIGVIAGDKGMAGAAVMAAQAALVTGAGRVSLFTHPEHARLINVAYPEIMCYGVDTLTCYKDLFEKIELLVVGCGMRSKSRWSEQRIVESFALNKAMVVDAGALDLVSQLGKTENDVIITPHEGEAARLLTMSADKVHRNRLEALTRLNQKFHCHVLLKGKGTLIYDNDNAAVSLCPYGEKVLATAGSGDILSGMIAGLYGQLKGLSQAGKLAVILQGLASERCVQAQGYFGFTAMQLLPFVSEVLNTCKSAG